MPRGHMVGCVIDVHCHILPALDDGARDLADSLAMARQAEADGIETVCATPHIRHDHGVAIEEIAGRVEDLQRELDRHGVGVRVEPAGELAATEADGLSASHLRMVALGGDGGWVLVEPAPGPLDDGYSALAERLTERGARVIVAHPERHAGADLADRLARLAAGGCLVQWTAAFVAAAADGDLVLELASAGLVHLLGSDAHSSHGGRPVRLAAGYARLAAVCSPRQVRWMADEAPRAVLAGEPVSPPW